MFSVTQIPAKEQRSCDQWCESPQTTCSYDGLPSVAGSMVLVTLLKMVPYCLSPVHPAPLIHCLCRLAYFTVSGSELFLAFRSWWLNCMMEIERVSFLVRLPPCCALLSLENFGFRSSSARALEFRGKKRRFLCAVTMVQDLLPRGDFLFNMD